MHCLLYPVAGHDFSATAAACPRQQSVLLRHHLAVQREANAL